VEQVDVIFAFAMTVLEALAILEAAVLESKKRDVDTPEVKQAGLIGALYPANVVDPTIPPSRRWT
jgi:hypothetical protein